MSSESKRKKAVVDVFRYRDYRKFLADYYDARKARGYSYRAFAKDAGIGAPNYLRLVIDGQRNLGPAMVDKFAKACALGADATAYFRALVAFNQASTPTAREQAFERLKGFRRYRRAQKLQLAQAAYYGNWYLPAIRELVRCVGFRADPEWIAALLRPAVKPSQVKRALQVLLDLGLVAIGADGEHRQSTDVVSTGAETHGMHIRNYHAEMMRHAVESMETVPREERDISSLTLSLGPNGLARLKQRLQEVRRELLDLGESEPDPVQVVQVNFQLYPLTHPIRRPPASEPTKRKS